MQRKPSRAQSPPPRSPGKLDMAQMHSTLGFLLSMTQQHLFRDFEAAFKKLKLRPRLYSILMLVRANPGCRLTDIGEALGILQTNLVKRIDVLVLRGLVSRVPDPADRRANALMLTVKGERIANEALQVHETLTRNFVARFGKDDYGQLIALLQKMNAVEDQYSQRRPPKYNGQRAPANGTDE